MTAEEKYNQQLESLDRFDKTYVQPIFDIDVFASQKGNGSEGLDASVSDKAENARIINKYLDFVEQYEGEVFYSIQNCWHFQQTMRGITSILMIRAFIAVHVTSMIT